MTNATLTAFRSLAETMTTSALDDDGPRHGTDRPQFGPHRR